MKIGVGIGINFDAAGTGQSSPMIALSSSVVSEDAEIGDVVGALSVAYGSGSYTFSITSDPDGKFEIDGTDLKLIDTLDHETDTSHSVTVEADNGVDPPLTRVITITVANVLEVTLVALTLSADEIEEGASENTEVGSIVGASSGSTLVLTGNAGGRFKLVDGDVLAGSVATDYETATSHNITIRETHPDATTRDTIIPIAVLDVDDVAPTITSASTGSVSENSALSFALTASEAVTWSIVGGADQAEFEIDGSTLMWALDGAQDYESPQDANADNAYVVHVRATDGASNTADQTITITVTDVSEGGGVTYFTTFLSMGQY